MYLPTTSDAIRLITDKSTAVDWVTSFVDITSSATTPGSQTGQVASATTTKIVNEPGASTQRLVKYVSVFNTSSSDNVTVQLVRYNGTSDFVMRSTTLQPRESLHYNDTTGWQVFREDGTPKGGLVIAAPVPSINVSPIFATANLTGTKTITSTNSFAVYMGKAPRPLTSVVMRYRVTTAAATITWAEVALAKGAPVLAGNPSLTVVGTADVSAVINSTGQKSTTINVNGAQTVGEGDDLWLLIGNQATTAAVVRAQSIADDLQAGFQASAVQRPSLIVGTPTSFTLEGATTLAAWVAIAY